MKKRLLLLILFTLLSIGNGCQVRSAHFEGQRALKHVQALCELGPRPAGQEANRKAAEYIGNTLQRYGWSVEKQSFIYSREALQNVIAKRGKGPLVVIGTHFDTRPIADRDPTDRSRPILGANDGGSGTAVLLELARVLDESVFQNIEVWLVFFDGEDRGDLGGWAWCVGSQHFVASLRRRPEYALIVDMVGDQDQRIYYEWSSTLWLQEKVWRIANELGYSKHFVPRYRYRIIDDHTSFLTMGIPAAVIIDFDYPYWHTLQDTPDKISSQSLQRIGDVLEYLLEKEPLGASGN